MAHDDDEIQDAALNSYWSMRKASINNREAIEELDRICEEFHRGWILESNGKLIRGRWNWWFEYPKVDKASIKRYYFWRGSKDFEHPDDAILIEIQPTWNMANVVKEAGLFQSSSDARKNGWNKPVEPGLKHIIWNQKKGIDIYTNTT